MTDRDLERIKREIADAETAYALIKKVFESTNHYSAKKDIHEAIYSIHQALQYLKEQAKP